MFWENFDYLSRKIGSNPNAVAAECGVKSSGSVSAWKNGTMPQKKTIEKIASFFGITSEELMGEFIPEKQKAPSEDDAEWVEIMSRTEFRQLFHAMRNSSREEILAIATAWEARKNRGDND